MTASTVLGAVAFIALLIGIGAMAHYLVALIADYRDLQRQEEQYARDWVAAHKTHQDKGRYLTDDPNRPEN